MCSICGGLSWDNFSMAIWISSRDRGRDDSGIIYGQSNVWIGNHRAIPTTEVESPIEKQPVGNGPWFVFNGIISNDEELGIRDGEADTSVIPRIVNGETVADLWEAVQKIKGSFAIAEMTRTGRILLACNYKPIWVAEIDGTLYFSSLKQHFPSESHPVRFPPYFVADIEDWWEYGGGYELPRRQGSSGIVICSSGLDSTAVAAYARTRHDNLVLLHFLYGCMAQTREMDRIRKIAKYLDCKCHFIPIPDIFGNSSLLSGDDSVIVSGKGGAEYAHEWVPARNLVMLSLATAFAESHDFGHIYLGTNLEEAGAYPDNEEQFILDFAHLLYGAVQEGLKIEIHTPLGGLMKHEIIPFGRKYDAPFHLTWSCYKGGERPCGVCGPCFMRKVAFERNGLVDPVTYVEEN